MFFRKYQKKEKTSKKAGEHREREELSSSTGEKWRASGKSGEAEGKSGVSFTTPEKGEELQKKLVNTVSALIDARSRKTNDIPIAPYILIA